MSTTDELQAQIDYIVNCLNDIQVAITNLASSAQLRQLTLLRQKDINELESRVSTLETAVAELQKK